MAIRVVAWLGRYKHIWIDLNGGANTKNSNSKTTNMKIKMKLILSIAITGMLALSALAQPSLTNIGTGTFTNFPFAGKTNTFDWKWFPDADSNHMFSVYRATVLTGPFSLLTNCPGGTLIQITNEQSYYKLATNDGFVIWSTSQVIGTANDSCLGSNRVGYAVWQKTYANGWGWVPDTNQSPFVINYVLRSDAAVQYFSEYGQNDCGHSPLSFTTIFTGPGYPVPSFQFAAYYPSNVPTNSTWLWLQHGWMTNTYATSSFVDGSFTPPDWSVIPDIYKAGQREIETKAAMAALKATLDRIK